MRHPFFIASATQLEMHLLEGPDYGHSTDERKSEKLEEEEEKSPALAGFEPTTS